MVESDLLRTNNIRKDRLKFSIGDKKDKLLIIDGPYLRKYKIYWKCKCDCGNICFKRQDHLIKDKSCGCYVKITNAIINMKRRGIKTRILNSKDDMIGKRFGKLVVLSIFDYDIGEPKKYLCQCDCGKQKVIYKINLKNGNAKSCGCLKDDYRKKREKELLGLKIGRLTILKITDFYSPMKVLCKCECGNEKEIVYNNIKRGMTTSCGCYRIERVHEVSYNPLLTEEQRKRRRKEIGDHSIKKWRKKVFDRDNYTCQNCLDNTGGNLVAHHLYSYADNELVRYDIDNGITLCEKCHKKFHDTYGYGVNTLEQFVEFLRDN